MVADLHRSQSGSAGDYNIRTRFPETLLGIRVFFGGERKLVFLQTEQFKLL